MAAKRCLFPPFLMHSQSAIHEAVASIHGDSQFMTRRVNSFSFASANISNCRQAIYRATNDSISSCEATYRLSYDLRSLPKLVSALSCLSHYRRDTACRVRNQHIDKFNEHRRGGHRPSYLYGKVHPTSTLSRWSRGGSYFCPVRQK